MKNIFKTVIAAALITGLATSCDEDQNLMVVSPEATFSILTPQSGESVELNPATPNNPGLVLAWEDADYTSPTAVTYTVEVAANNTNFAEPVAVASTSNTFITVSSATLNDAALDIHLAPFVQSGMDVRIKATVGNPATMETYSNVITYLVTPFSNELPKLAVPGNHQGWDPAAADVPVLASAGFGQTNYEGYVWLDGEYKFLMPDAAGAFAWGNTDYGDNGSFSGVLAEQGEVNAIAPVAGYYLVRANTGLLTYSAQLTNWGIIGSATPDGWNSDQNMTYDPATKKWTITLNLVGGQEIKFRANDDWGLNYGDTGNDGSLNEGGDNIPVATSGNYTVTLDLSTPRAYTYSLQLN